MLLKGVNDSLEAQIALQKNLFEAGVLPYYLHLLDPVKGSAHFEVDLPSALVLMERLRNALLGYLVPKLVREIPGEKSKSPATLIDGTLV